MANQSKLGVGVRVYACCHPDGTRRTPRHYFSDLGTVIEHHLRKGAAVAGVAWDTGEVDEHDASTGRCLDHPFSALSVRKLRREVPRG